MTQHKLADTAVTIIRREADLIERHGWCRKIADNLAARRGIFGLNLSLAACWAVHGEPCQPKELTEAESAKVAEILDIIEAGLRMRLLDYEAKYADALAAHVANDLRLVAYNLAQELQTGGTTLTRTVSPYGDRT